MRFLRYVATVLVASTVLYSTATAMEVSPPIPLQPQSPLTISSYSIGQEGVPKYFEIFNSSSVPQKISDWQFAMQWSAKVATVGVPTSSINVTLSNRDDLYIPPEGYVVLSFNSAVSGANLEVGSLVVNPDNYASKVSLVHSRAEYRPFERVFAQNVTQLPMRLTQGANGYNTTYAAENRTDKFPWQTPLHVVSSYTNLQIVEIYPNPAACHPFDTTTVCNDYVKIFNPGQEMTDLAQLRFRSGLPTQNASSSNSTIVSGGLPPGAYAIVPLNLTNSGGAVWIEDKYGLVQHQSTTVVYPDSSGQKGKSWAYDSSTHQWRWSSYPTPYNEPNRFTDGAPVNSCSALRLSEIGANLSDQFVEIYNASNEPVNIQGCQLQTNRSSEINYVFGDQMLGSGDFATVRIADTKLSLTKTTTGTVYLLSSDGLTEVDARSYENMSEKSSYALVDGVWRQTFAVTPGSLNSHEQYLPCEAGYERNVDTGRCNKVVVAAIAVACDVDEYRNPETNRCRKLTTTSSALTPCKEGQYRSPETNRCRSLDTASAELKPCAIGQERNPETNRCRKSAEGDSAAGFKVVDTPVGSDQLLSWLALGGVGVTALGYAGWEWRREVSSAVLRMFSLLPFVK